MLKKRNQITQESINQSSNGILTWRQVIFRELFRNLSWFMKLPRWTLKLASTTSLHIVSNPALSFAFTIQLYLTNTVDTALLNVLKLNPCRDLPVQATDIVAVA
jgi:hypothetical protein